MSKSPLRTFSRVLLGGTLVFAGVSHLTTARKAFQAQVPKSLTDNLPVTEDQVVVASGIAEITLGALLATVPKRGVGTFAALFFAAVFPGNLAQLANHRDAFGLDTDRKRALRLVGQPLLISWALWSRRPRRSSDK